MYMNRSEIKYNKKVKGVSLYRNMELRYWLVPGNVKITE